MADAVVGIGATCRSVIGDSLVGAPDTVLSHIGKQATVERSLRRRKAKANAVPPIPQSLSFGIPDQYADMVLADSGVDDPQRILALGHRRLVEQLSRQETWFADGTFKVVPEVFFQLYTIHVDIGGRYPPVIYFLLPNKTGPMYHRMCTMLATLVPDAHPQRILVDFEKAPISAFEEAYPGTSMSGCMFHLGQAVIRKVQEVGLKGWYEQDIEFGVRVKSLISLAFLPPGDVLAGFFEVAESFEEPDDSTQELLEYFEKTFVRRVRGRIERPGMYNIEFWNQAAVAAEGGPKTTNACEGYHTALQALFRWSHPTVWALLHGLKRDVSLHLLTMQSSANGHVAPQRKLYRQLGARQAGVIASYDPANKIGFLRAMSHVLRR